MADGMFSMFDPNAYQQQRAQEAQKAAMAYAQQTPQQRTDAAGYGFGGALAGGVRSLLGIQDKGLMQVQQANEVMKNVDRNDPEAMLAAAKALGDAGNMQAGEAVYKAAMEIKAAQSKAALEAAKTQREEAQATEIPRMRHEEALLRIQATQEAALQRAEAAKQRSEDTRLAIEQRREAAAQAADARREATAARVQMAQLVSSVKDGQGGKPITAAELKAQEKKETKEAGQQGLSDSLSRASTLVNEIYDLGGMTSTSKSPLSNLGISAQTGTIGQYIGQKTGSAAQSKRDELASVRSQILNDIKEATGMSASQLNSNIELQLWMKALGSEGMTKEANLAIIKNINDKYIKGITKPGSSATPDINALLEKYK